MTDKIFLGLVTNSRPQANLTVVNNKSGITSSLSKIEKFVPHISTRFIITTV